MAHVYVRSAAAGTGTGADWTNAYTTLAAAFTAKAAGDNFWISEDHAETQGGSIILTSPGTATSFCTAICVNHAGSVPPVAADFRTTATVTTTGGNFLTNGFWYTRGITFTSAGDTNILGWTAASGTIAESCKFTLTNGGAAELWFNTDSSSVNSFVRLIACTIKFGATSHYLILRSGKLVIEGGSIDGAGSIPTSLIGVACGLATIRGMDLSALGSGNLVGAIGAGANYDIVFDSCKLGASFVLSASQTYPGNAYLINSDSAATNYRNQKANYLGSQVPETTIVRTGGATDGTTPIATKIVTTAVPTWINPYEALPLTVWNDTTGSSVTVTVCGVWGGGAVPNNDDIWIEVSYPGSSATPIATIDRSNTKATYLTSNAAQSTDASTWGGSTTAFKMIVTIAPAMKGLIYVWPKAAASGATFYLDPDPVLS